MESPAYRKMGAIAAHNQFGSAGSTTQVYSQGWNEWKLFAAPIFLSTGTFLSTRSTRLGEPPPVSLLSWSRGCLVIGATSIPSVSASLVVVTGYLLGVGMINGSQTIVREKLLVSK